MLAMIHNFTHHHKPGEEDEDGEGDGNEPISGRVKNDNNKAEWADVGINELDMRRNGIASDFVQYRELGQLHKAEIADGKYLTIEGFGMVIGHSKMPHGEIGRAHV